MKTKNWHQKLSILSIALLLSPIVSHALTFDYPTIAGKTITDQSSFADVSAYLFALFIAVGVLIAFIRVVSIGLGMITAGATLSSAREKIKGSLIGLFILLSTYLIINTLNSKILNIENPDIKCINGFSVKHIVKAKNAAGEDRESEKETCIMADNPQLPENMIGQGEAEMTPCHYKAIIGYSGPNYTGTPSIIFDDKSPADTGCPVPNVDITGFKSVKMLVKFPGLYFYLTDGSQKFSNEMDDFAKLGLDEKSIQTIEVLNKDYTNPIEDPLNRNNKITRDHYYGLAFGDPGFKGRCKIFDEEEPFVSEGTVLGDDTAKGASSIVAIRSRIKEKQPGDSYIYLYPVKDCGKVANTDHKSDNQDDPDPDPDPDSSAKCGSAHGQLATSCPPSGQMCSSGTVRNMKDIRTGCGWSCEGADGKSVMCFAPYQTGKGQGNDYFSKALRYVKGGLFSLLGYVEEAVSYISDRLPINMIAFGGGDDDRLPQDLCGRCAGENDLFVIGGTYYYYKDDGSYEECFLCAGIKPSPTYGPVASNGGYTWNCSLDLPLWKDVDTCTSYASSLKEVECGTEHRHKTPDGTTPNAYTPPNGLCLKGTPTAVTSDYYYHRWQCKDGQSSVDCYTNRVYEPFQGAECNTEIEAKHYSSDSPPQPLISDGKLCNGGYAPFPPQKLPYANIYGESLEGTPKYNGVKTDTHWFWYCANATSSANNPYMDGFRGGAWKICKAPLKPECGSKPEENCTDSQKAGLNLCKIGKGTMTGQGGNISWDCENEGETVSCSCKGGGAGCGVAHGMVIDGEPPADGLCSGGEAKELKKGYEGWTWKCVDEKGKTTSCRAFLSGGADEPGGDPGPKTDPEKVTDPETLNKFCKIKIPSAGASLIDISKLIKSECAESLKKDKNGDLYDVVSIKIDAQTAVVVRGTNGKCLYLSQSQIEKSGGCIGDIRGSDIYDTRLWGVVSRPEELIIMTRE
jgi:hypothetical protein